MKQGASRFAFHVIAEVINAIPPVLLMSIFIAECLVLYRVKGKVVPVLK
jgi:hypothetical protein